MTTPAPALKLTNLNAGYPDGPRGAHFTQILHDLNLTVQAGEMHAILGPSGCGKSTLLKILAGLLPAQSGTVELDGEVVVDAAKMVPPERRNVGVVPQDAALFPHMTVAQNVEFGLKSRHNRANHPHHTPAQRKAQVNKMLSLVGLAQMGDRMPNELSGGQRQRVALARALAPEPKLVLLDEAFGALDAALRNQLRHEVRQILREANATGLLVTHDQDEALSTADRITIMFQGRIIQTGTPTEVYSKPTTIWVGKFLGECSVLDGTTDGTTLHTALGSRPYNGPVGRVQVLVRPEQLLVYRERGASPSGVAATVTGVEYRGHSTRYRVKLVHNGQELSALQRGAPAFQVDDDVIVSAMHDSHILHEPDDPHLLPQFRDPIEVPQG